MPSSNKKNQNQTNKNQVTNNQNQQNIKLKAQVNTTK